MKKSELRKIIKESIKELMKEDTIDPWWKKKKGCSANPCQMTVEHEGTTLTMMVPCDSELCLCNLGSWGNMGWEHTIKCGQGGSSGITIPPAGVKGSPSNPVSAERDPQLYKSIVQISQQYASEPRTPIGGTGAEVGGCASKTCKVVLKSDEQIRTFTVPCKKSRHTTPCFCGLSAAITSSINCDSAQSNNIQINWDELDKFQRIQLNRDLGGGLNKIK